MCRDEDDGWVAVEIKRVGTIDAVEQLSRYLERIRLDPAKADCEGILAAQQFKPQAVTLAEARGIRCAEVDLAVLRGEREPELTLFALSSLPAGIKTGGTLADEVLGRLREHLDRDQPSSPLPASRRHVSSRAGGEAHGLLHRRRDDPRPRRPRRNRALGRDRLASTICCAARTGAGCRSRSARRSRATSATSSPTARPRAPTGCRSDASARSSRAASASSSRAAASRSTSRRSPRPACPSAGRGSASTP